MTAPGPKRANPPPELPLSDIEDAQRGDPRARRALVLRYQRPVFAVLSRVLRGRASKTLIEDLAQETFLKVFRALNTFDPARGTRLSSWILTIASNLAVDELRRRRPDFQPLHLAAEPAQLGWDGRTDGQTERAHLAKLLDDAVQDLPPEFRAAFVLREFHGLDYAEIASALEVDLGTVKSRLNRARKRLRASLQEVYDVH